MDWSEDKFGRWRSIDYLRWVRSLSCCCRDSRCPNCGINPSGKTDHVVAAHIRYGTDVGLGIKPDDFLVIPLTNTIHTIFHQSGHPALKWQMERLAGVLCMAFRRGVLKLDEPGPGMIAF